MLKKILYNIHSLKIGLKIIHNQHPCIIVSNECIKPGKGLAFNRIRLKQIVSGKILERTVKSGEFLESADVTDNKLIYLYRNKDYFSFMYEESFEQISIHITVIATAIKWMIERIVYVITFWNNTPILVTPPECMQLKIIDTAPPIIKKKSCTFSGDKVAIVSTGASVKVPFFIQVGEYIKINTQTGLYISRVK